jgi:hypothetical protein
LRKAIKSKWNDFLHTIFVRWFLYPICAYQFLTKLPNIIILSAQ